MQIHIHIHHHEGVASEVKQLLLTIKNQNKIIMATQAELKAQIDGLTTVVGKVGAETRTLLTKIEELLAEIAAGGTVSEELQASVDALAQQVAVVDELVPDAPPEPPVTL